MSNESLARVLAFTWFIWAVPYGAIMYRWQIPGVLRRDGLYTNDPARFIRPERLAAFKRWRLLCGLIGLLWMVGLAIFAYRKSLS
jgi:hypothetical protein